MLLGALSPRTRTLAAHGARRGTPLPPRAPGRLPLDLNELAGRAPSPEVAAAVRGFSALDAYPRDAGSRERLLSALAAYRGLASADGLLVTAGSDDALALVCAAHAHRAATSPPLFVLAPAPTYAGFAGMAGATDGVRLVCPLARSAEELADAVRWATSSARRGPPFAVIYAPAPAAPLGYEVPEAWAVEVAERNPGSLVVVDEAYGELVGREGRWGGSRLAAEAASGRLPNLLVTGTFSKAFGLAGLRVGYVATHPDNVRALTCLAHPHAVTDLAREAAAAALRSRAHYEAGFAALGRAREALAAELAGWAGAAHVPAAGMSMLAFAPDPARAAALLAAEHGVAAAAVRTDRLSALRLTLPADDAGVARLLAALHGARASGLLRAADGTLPVA